MENERGNLAFCLLYGVISEGMDADGRWRDADLRRQKGTCSVRARGRSSYRVRHTAIVSKVVALLGGDRGVEGERKTYCDVASRASKRSLCDLDADFTRSNNVTGFDAGGWGGEDGGDGCEEKHGDGGELHFGGGGGGAG